MSEGNMEMVRILRERNARDAQNDEPKANEARDPNARKSKWDKWAVEEEPPKEVVAPKESPLDAKITRETSPANGLKKEEPLKVQKANVAPQKANFAPQKANFAPQKANFAPQRANFAPQRANFAPQKANFAPQKANFAPQKTWRGFQAKRHMRPRQFMDTRHLVVKPQGHTPPKAGSPAKSSDSLPTDDSDRPSVLAEQFRMITIGGLPHDVTHSELQHIIRGGPILGVRLIAGYPLSFAEIVFVNEKHALAYYDFMASGSFLFRGLKLRLKLDKGPTIKKAERLNLSRKEISRVLLVKPKAIERGTMQLIKEVAETIPLRAKRSHTYVEATRFSDRSLQAYKLQFSHLRDAMEAHEKFQEMGFQTAFMRDVCVGSISELPRRREWPVVAKTIEA
jgi:hypothetical protein